MLFCSKFCKVDKYFWGVVYERRDGTKKWEWMIKQRRKPLSYLCRTVIGTCYCIWNRNIWHPPRQRKRVNILYIPFLFISKQFISKYSWHVLLMLTQARRNRGAGAGLIKITNFYVNFQEKCFNWSKSV